jgi:putative transposase
VLSIISGNWQKFLAGAFLTEEKEEIRKHERTGRPLGGSVFVDSLERKLGRKLKPQKPGRKPREK